jgi:hypothetical protein
MAELGVALAPHVPKTALISVHVENGSEVDLLVRGKVGAFLNSWVNNRFNASDISSNKRVTLLLVDSSRLLNLI